jgi:nucleotide-binding universal stress UspA family protein
MFTHLLVTLDGSARAETVITHAIDIGRTMGAQITLLRVIDPASSGWGERGAIGKSPSESTIRSLYVEQAQAYLQRVANQMEKSGLSVKTVVREGQPARQIVATAREVEADGIAMATQSRRGLNKLMFGSVAEAVLHEANVPILLLRA